MFVLDLCRRSPRLSLAPSARFVSQWESLEGKIDDERWSDQLFRQVYQAGHALAWRDAIVDFYHNMTGIADDKGRVGYHPCRMEAESMELENYVPYAVTPLEAASNKTVIVTSRNSTADTASTSLPFASGTYNIAVDYFDLYGGSSHFTLLRNNATIGSWSADMRPYIRSKAAPRVLGHTPSIYIDGHSVTRVTFPSIDVQEADVLRIVGVPDGIEPAPLDYVSVLPVGVVD